MAAPIPKFIGERIRRREDPRLVLGKASYTDDLRLEGTLSAAILRSPHAHARIKAIRVSEALKLEGVIEVTIGEDLRGKVGSLPCAWPVANRPFHPVLALDKVRFVGEPVAIVVARDAYLAHDALELLEVDYEPLPAVTDPEKSLEPGAPLIHEQFGSNIVQQAEHPSDKIDDVMRQADCVIRFRFANQRLVPMSMETRGVLASWDAAKEEIVLWSSTQMPHIVRSYVAEMIGLGENQLRVIAPEVGGGFGAKSNVYREEALLAFLTRKLGRPVKWIEQRREHLATLTHGRGQVAYVEAAVKRDGTILGIKARLIGDMGAYLHLLTPMVPGLTGLMLPNTYKFQATSFTQQLVFTNKMSTPSTIRCAPAARSQ